LIKLQIRNAGKTILATRVVDKEVNALNHDKVDPISSKAAVVSNNVDKVEITKVDSNNVLQDPKVVGSSKVEQDRVASSNVLRIQTETREDQTLIKINNDLETPTREERKANILQEPGFKSWLFCT
jgi:hypothetical protein